MVEESVWETVKRELPADWLADEPTSEEIHLGAKQTRYGKAAGAEGFWQNFQNIGLNSHLQEEIQGLVKIMWNRATAAQFQAKRQRGGLKVGLKASSFLCSKVKVVETTRTNTVESPC